MLKYFWYFKEVKFLWKFEANQMDVFFGKDALKFFFDKEYSCSLEIFKPLRSIFAFGMCDLTNSRFGLFVL